MRILITGGAGCLGSNLIEHWLPQGHDILVIDNFATGQRETVPSACHGWMSIEGSDLPTARLVDRAFDDFAPTHVVHAAAAYKDPDDWREDVATNVLGSINVVSAARAAKVKRFINLQTALCYGAPGSVPIPVDHPCRPVSSYGISKTAGRSYVAAIRLPFVSLRLASVIGPRLSIGAIPTFYTRLKAGKSVFCTTAVRDFLDMSDFLAFMDLAMKARRTGRHLQSRPGRGHSIRDVLEAVASASPAGSSIRSTSGR